MANRFYKPYRGYRIEVRVIPGNSAMASNVGTPLHGPFFP
jgi:precorrin-3B methylase